MRPWFVWNVLFRLQERIKGHPTFEILREMEAADRLSFDEMEQLRVARLRDFLNYCNANVPFVAARMRDAGLKSADNFEIDDLRHLPIMRKADMRKNRDALRSQVAGKLSSSATGGSSGDPLVFDLSKRRIASRVACRQRVARWWGMSVGDPELALWGSPIELSRQDRVRKFRDWLLATRLLSAFDMTEQSMSEYLDVIQEGRWRQIFAYPSAAYQLCLYARRQKRNLRTAGIKVIFVTSEVLYPHQRELISETFNCPVANGYGGRDSGFISHECPQGGMHILTDTVIVEVVDAEGWPSPRGTPGEIVCTDLYSHESPFLRYATGDIGVLSDRRCGCGRALPLLEEIAGRSNDCIIAPDGRVINDQALVYLLRNVDGIEQFRIRQTAVDRLHVQLVRNELFAADAEERLRNGWNSLFRARIEVTFEYLTAFSSESSGKFRHIVSDISGRQDLQAAGDAERGRNQACPS